MQNIDQALSDIRDLYKRVLGTPAPEVPSSSFVPFPPECDPVEYAMEEVDRLQQVVEQISAAPAPIAWIPRADAFAQQGDLVIRLEIPGMTRKEIQVFVTNSEIIVRGDRKPPTVEHDLKPLSLELQWGPFERRFALPNGASSASVTAKYADGVLEVRAATDTSGLQEDTMVEVH